MAFFQFAEDLSVDIEYYFIRLATLINTNQVSGLLIEKAERFRWGYYWQETTPELPAQVLSLGNFSKRPVSIPDSFYITRNLFKTPDRLVGVSGKVIEDYKAFPIEELVRGDQSFSLSISINPQQRLPVSNQGTLVSVFTACNNYQVAQTIATWFDARVSTEKREMLALRSELPYLLRPPISSESYNREGCFQLSSSINSFFLQNPDLLTRHCLICGQTGYGKTNTAKFIIRQALECDRKPHVMLIDFKQEYEDIATHYSFPYIHLSDPQEVSKLNVNPFMPGENVSLINHLELLATIFSVSGFSASGPLLPEYMKQVIYAFFKWFWNISDPIFCSLLYRKGSFLRDNNYRFYSTKIAMPLLFAEFWQTFRDDGFDLLFSSSPGKNLADIKSTISARINGLKYSSLNSFTYDKNAVPFDKLLEQSLALSFKDVAEGQIVLMLSLLILLTSAAARTRNNSTNLLNIILIEEAHLILKRSIHSAEVLDASQVLSDQIERVLAEIRAKGVGMVIVDQSPSKLVRSVLANTATKIAHRITLTEDLDDMYSALGLSEPIGLQNLGVGVCYHKIDNQPITSEKIKIWDS